MDNTTSFGVNHSTSAFTYGYIRIPYGVLITYNIFLSLVIIFGISGNLLVILVFAKHKPVTAADLFILFIAVFDFLSSSVNVPIYLSLTTGLWKFIGSDILCKVHMFLSQTVVLTSTFLICGLALERCHKVCYRGSVRISNAKCYILLIILLMTVLSTPSLLAFTKERGNCYPRMGLQWVFVYFLFVFLTFVIATCVVVVSYTKIVIAVKGSEANVKRHQVGQGFKLSKSTLWKRQSKNNFGTNDAKHSVTLTKRTFWRRRSNNKIGTSEAVKNAGSCYNGDNLEQRLHVELCNRPPTSHQHESIPSTSYLYKPTVQTDVWTIQTSSSEELACDVIKKTQAYDVNNGIWPIDNEINKIRKESSNESIRYNGWCGDGKHVTHARDKGTNLKTTKIAFLVCMIFITSWVPPWCVFFSAFVSNMDAAFVMFSLFGRMTYLLNTFTNPFVYMGMNYKFKGKVVGVLKCR